MRLARPASPTAAPPSPPAGRRGACSTCAYARMGRAYGNAYAHARHLQGPLDQRQPRTPSLGGRGEVRESRRRVLRARQPRPVRALLRRGRAQRAARAQRGRRRPGRWVGPRRASRPHPQHVAAAARGGVRRGRAQSERDTRRGEQREHAQRRCAGAVTRLRTRLRTGMHIDVRAGIRQRTRPHTGTHIDIGTGSGAHHPPRPPRRRAAPVRAGCRPGTDTAAAARASQKQTTSSTTVVKQRIAPEACVKHTPQPPARNVSQSEANCNTSSTRVHARQLARARLQADEARGRERETR